MSRLLQHCKLKHNLPRLRREQSELLYYLQGQSQREKTYSLIDFYSELFKEHPPPQPPAPDNSHMTRNCLSAADVQIESHKTVHLRVSAKSGISVNFSESLTDLPTLQTLWYLDLNFKGVIIVLYLN